MLYAGILCVFYFIYCVQCQSFSQNIEFLHIADIFLRGIIELDVVLVEHVSLSFSSVGFFQTDLVSKPPPNDEP